jgi:DNA mismatch repair ATPase MutS
MAAHFAHFRNAIQGYARLDAISSLAILAASPNYSRPTVTAEKTALRIVQGRHPVLEQRIDYVPADTTLESAVIVTG